MSISSININKNNLNMKSFSLNNILQTLPKKSTPKISNKNKKIKKLIFSQIFQDKSLNENLPDIYTPLTPRGIIKPKKLIPKMSPKCRSIENYLLSTSLLTKYENINKFDFSYFKNMSIKYSPIISKRSIKPIELTDNMKKAYRNNIIINILKKKREEISKNEKLIEYSYNEYERQIDNEFIKFKRISNEFQSMQRKEAKILSYYRLIYQKAKKIYFLEMQKNKRLGDTIEKTIRDIYKLKEYAKFIHSMYGIPFLMDKINDRLLYENKFDILRNEIIKLYTNEELEKENDKKDKYLKDINLFMKNFILYENNILHLLNENNIIIKDIYYLKIDNKNRLKHLVQRKNDYDENKKSYIKIENNFRNELLSSAEQSENEIYQDTINYIIQFIKIFDIPITVNKKKDRELDYFKYCKDIADALKEKETIIDMYSREINEIINSKNERDKYMMEKIIFDRKRDNLRKLQFFTKENMQKKLELAKIKIMDKSKKKVIKGRSLFDYKYISLHSKEDKKKKEIEEQNRIKNNSNDINIEYCFSEYDKL